MSSSSSPGSTPPPPGYPDLGPEPVAEVRIIAAPAVPTAVVRAAGVRMSSIAGLFDAAFGQAFPELFARGITPAGPPFALYTRLTEGPDAVADVEIGFPLGERLAAPLAAVPAHDEPGAGDAPGAGDGPAGGGLRIVPSELPAGDIAVMSHVGGYDALGEAWGRLMAGIGGRGRAPGMPFWECYVTEPRPDMDPATLRTDLYCPTRQPDDAA